MKKILFVHHSAAWGGAPSCMINIINSLDKAKYEVEVLLLKNSIVASKLEENGIKYRIADSIFYCKYYKFFPHSEAGYIKWYQIYTFIEYSILWLLSRYIYAEKELSKSDVDIIHLNSSVLTDWLAPSRRKGKVIIHIREPFRRGRVDILHHFFKFLIKKHANQIIAISKDNSRRIGILKATKVIYDYCSFTQSEPSLNSYESKKVLYLGGSSPSKGFYTLVASLDYLGKDVVVYFGGHYTIDKKPRNIIKLIIYYISNAKKREKALKKIEGHPNARLIGLIYDVGRYLEDVCCLVSPFSVPHFSCPVIEAHSFMKPAIGSNVAGMEEIIEHEMNGLIVPKNDARALAVSINSLTGDCVKAMKYGKNGYAIASKKFTSQNIQQFIDLYNKISLE